MPKIESITQIAGIYAGHATNEEAATGCTVIVCPEGATGAVDVRGGAPATRETDLLRPEETVQALHAVVLSGGSAYGLAASTGVAEELERRDIGLDVMVAKVPIVSGACLFDLACGDAHVRPDASMGAQAVADAFAHAGEPLARGNVGAGAGCTVGKVAGPQRSMKTGRNTRVNRISSAHDHLVRGDQREADQGTGYQGRPDGCRRLCTRHQAHPHYKRWRQYLRDGNR